MKTSGLLLPLLFIVASLGFTNTAFAQQPTPTTACQPIFGGGEACKNVGNLITDLSIKNPVTGEYVQSLPQDIVFAPNQEITFQILVTNNNNGDVNNITVTNTFPQFVAPTGGAGSVDKTKRVVSIKVDKLKGNETKSFIITGKTATHNAFKQNKTCLANQVEVKAGNKISSDNMQFCIVKDTTVESFPTSQSQATMPTTQSVTKGGQTVHKTPEVKATPNTGPELLGLIALLPAAGAGLYLRKKGN